MLPRLLFAVAAGAVLSSCSSVYYSAMEKIGYEKRDLLIRAVKKARGEQKEAGEEFTDALTQLKKITGFKGGSLESAYDRFKAEYDDCEQQAAAVRAQVREVDQVAKDLFREWEREARQYESASLAADSRRKLADTRARFEQLSRSLHAAEDSMDPVLRQFRDQVLYLKHNLNAAAIGSLRGTADNIQASIQRLLDQMNRSIAEADRFIQTLQ
jgi:Skp family chaperone for outer membrane proteins